jgi:hypothetical protein
MYYNSKLNYYSNFPKILKAKICDNYVELGRGAAVKDPQWKWRDITQKKGVSHS